MEFVERLEIENNIITSHVIGEKPKKEKEGITYLYGKNIQANIGDDIRMYTDLQTGTKKPFTQLVEEGLVPVPEGKKLNEAGTDFVDMTDAEKVSAGLIQLKADEKIEGDYIVKKSKKELYDEGKLSKEEYNLYIDNLRQAAYRQEADPLGMQVMRGDIDKAVWLAKIAEIKQRYPKVE
ncbi:hypothetical protein JO41_12810 [Treponema sp. OMZ 838]|uniref:hypothetical protein n=1 Tax=Treponema sp. OMZ 838 TaxID=1539298 RepID=UPI0005300F42|nr:hypothetical protein [Treponema sp. OMZ 838]AIW89780.1 hypothetical protein JO41_08235 [Treponema sp. OMZ 838]AIW90590.1 hypothetical protein JO41_12810 [Treponema sp. OMZ 838]